MQKTGAGNPQRRKKTMKAFAGYYDDENGDFYELKEAVNGGAIFYEVEYIHKKGFCRTEREVFFSDYDIKYLRLH